MQIVKSLALAFGLGALGTASIVACSVTTTSSGPDLGDGGGNGGSSQPTKADSGTSGGGGGGGTSCERMCEKAASASCSKQSSCVSDCQKQLDSIPAACKDKGDALIECGATHATSFTCRSDGSASASGCDAEGTALFSCLQNPGGGGGGDTDSGASSCGTIKVGSSAACQACSDQNCCNEKAACTGNTECMAILDCFATKNCNDEACYQACEDQHPTGKSAELAMSTCISDGCDSKCP